MHSIKLNLPLKLMFGNYCLDEFIQEIIALSFRKIMIIADPNVKDGLQKIVSGFKEAGTFFIVNTEISKEPTVEEFNVIHTQAEENHIDAVIGMGGGSVLDVAKLIAALCFTGNSIENAFGNRNISQRKLFLACIPTTSGTGSEVSPNAILLDEQDNLKKAVISPYIVPDIACVDPILTHSVPESITAHTGIDALTHCIEAFANRFAHPMIDLYAIEGIRLLFENLPLAFENGSDVKAREGIALGSLYGGMCLGPVNTAAVHALAYPLGSEYKLSHGLSNAMLLPHVLEYNLPEGADRYAAIAKAIGVIGNHSNIDKAKEGIERIKALCEILHIPQKLTNFNISVSDIPELTNSALKVERLLKNNPRILSEEDITNIYYKLF